MENQKVKLFSDGACRGNPGIGGAGAVITDDSGHVLWEGSQYLGQCTNNIVTGKTKLKDKIRVYEAANKEQLTIEQRNELKKMQHRQKLINKKIRELTKEIK